MSRARTLSTVVLAALTLAGFALLVALLVPADAGAVQPAPVALVQAPALDEDPFLGALLGDAGLPANAEDLSLAADRVCEGVTAEVPVVVMADAIAAEFSVDDEQAREFVNLAATVRCSGV